MAKQVFTKEFHGRTITIETGELAKQAGGAVLVRYNDTVVLSTATANHTRKDTDFFPLTVSYEEKMYSVGKIPGGFLRREGRPTEHATLTARMIDRPIRPLFPDGFRNEVQVVNTVLSVDPNVSSEMAAMLGSSLALSISDIPFNGPIAGVIIGRVDGKFVVNPDVETSEKSDIHLTVAGTKYAINMVEAGAKEVGEEDMLDALMYAHECIKELCLWEEEIIAQCGKPKMEFEVYSIDPTIVDYIDTHAKADLVAAVSIHEKLERYGRIDAISDEMAQQVKALDCYTTEAQQAKAEKQAHEYCTSIVAGEVRRLISVEKIRPDGRQLDELRPLNSQVDLLPRVHGSALFTRGETQVLSITTLGPLGENQVIDDVTEVEEKRFMHQYNFPPYSVGETGRMGSPGRREIGHGALGERALLQVLPSEEEFPYCIRTVAEVLESNGSSSQASICAGTMSLMAAGVPIKAPVAGVAMGLITVGDTYSILTDIQGMEDHYGDMDFKVAGTRHGITALQMDIKVEGISREIFKEALAQAKKGRFEILDNMEATIAAPRDHVSQYAPKMETFMIDPDKIREVIGTGGKVINGIIDECDKVKIDIEDDGKVVIYHTDAAAIAKARTMIENIVREAKVGEIYEGAITRIENYGIFVNLFGNCEGLCHVSKLRWERVEDPNDLYKIGDVVRVVVDAIDEKGKVSCSIRDLMQKPEGYVEPKPQARNKDRNHSRGNNHFNGERRSFKKGE